MGVNVYGVEPLNDKGKYFRNNCWYWRPLWDYTYEHCSDVLTERDHESGHYNDGCIIERERAERISAKLRQLCASGEVLDFEREYKRHMGPFVSRTWYSFEAENVLEFAEFCEASGGFRISR